MIEINNLTKKYGTLKALDSVSLKLPNCGLVAIYGENGCGKTTLLNVLSTADNNYVGEISYNGINYREITNQLRRDTISFVLQEKYFISYLNVYDNLVLFSENETVDEVAEELAAYSILEKGGESANNLSGGQRQRASLIRGVLKKSEVLLVDEPTSSLNEEMERFVFLKLQQYAKEKLVVLVSHNISLIRTYADLIIHMEKGCIQSVENNSRADIEYVEDCVILPPDFYNLSVLDPERIKKSFCTQGQITLKVKQTGVQKHQLSYETQEIHSWRPPKRMSKRLRSHLVWSAMKKKKASILLMTALICLFAVIINFLLSFTNFNEHEFVFESLTGNIDGFIHYKYSQAVYTSQTEQVYFDIAAYKALKNSATASLLLHDYDAEVCLEFENTGIYDHTIYGFAYCDEDDVEVMHGTFPKAGEVLITDYLALGLIYGSQEYSDYQAIIQKGIIVNGVQFSVSGVIDTDYEKYNGVYENPDFVNSQKYIDYQNNIQNVYSRLYYSLQEYETNEDLFYVPLEYGTSFARVLSAGRLNTQSEQNLMSQESCYINTVLYSQIGDVDSIKLNEYFLVVEGVVDDGMHENIIYTTSAKKQEIKDGQLASIKAIAIEINSVEQVASLSKYHMEHTTSISSYIRKTIEVITLSKELFAYAMILLAVFLCAAVYSMVHKLISSDNLAIALLKMSGYSWQSISAIEMSKLIMAVCVSCVASTVLFWGSSWMINHLLSRAFNMSIHISLINILSVVYTNLLIVGTFSVAGLIVMVAKFRKNIVDLIQSI